MVHTHLFQDNLDALETAAPFRVSFGKMTVNLVGISCE